LLNTWRNYKSTKHQKNFENLSTREVFTKIYEESIWGKSPDANQRYFSGWGSHDPAIVGVYVKAVETFLSSLGKKPNVVDLGCGDFVVGSKFRNLCDRYVACDIVESVIQFNREKYKGLDVDFRVLDLTSEPLPEGDVVFLRQVLQHLPNSVIAKAIPEIEAKYKYLVLTEHLPDTDNFAANVDHPAGPDVRSVLGSGLILTLPPFNLRVKEERVLCEVPDPSGVIRTNLYRLR
jgi:SAM-dependent methyltransferase